MSNQPSSQNFFAAPETIKKRDVLPSSFHNQMLFGPNMEDEHRKIRETFKPVMHSNRVILPVQKDEPEGLSLYNHEDVMKHTTRDISENERPIKNAQHKSLHLFTNIAQAHREPERSDVEVTFVSLATTTAQPEQTVKNLEEIEM